MIGTLNVTTAKMQLFLVAQSRSSRCLGQLLIDLNFTKKV